MKTTITKKVISVLSAGFLVGSTMLGAVAASYPEPFVKNYLFDGNIVVGSNAKAEDILGSVDIATSLQYRLKQPTNINTGSTDSSVSSGFKVQKSGEYFGYGNDIADVMQNSSLSEDDLPSVLSDGKYVDSQGTTKNSITYTQKLLFLDGNAELEYTQDDDLAPSASDYLIIRENKPLYTYTIDFDNAVKYDNEDDTTALNDFKTTTLTIQGKTYTITDASLTHDDGELDKLTFISGDSVVWLTQNQPITRMLNGVEHKIEVLDVTEQADACQVRVDGTTSIVDVDTMKTINGVQIGVPDVRAMHAQLQDVDVCQISLGASELEFKDGENVRVDDTELDGTEVNFDQTQGELNSIIIDYTPRELEDNLYLSKNKAFTDPIFGSWKIVYGGLTGDYSTYSIKTIGDHEAEFKFTSNDNKNIVIPLYSEDNRTRLGTGEDTDDKYYANAIYSGATTLDNSCQGISECEGMRIIATPSNGETHIFEITHIDTDDNTLDIKDYTYGRSYSDLIYTENSSTSLDLGSFGSFKALINETGDNVVVYETMKSKPEMNNNVEITITQGDNIEFDITEGDAGSNVLNVDLSTDSNDELDVNAHWTNPSISKVDSSEHSDESIMVTSAGTKVTTDDDETSVIVQSPDSDDEVYGNVFVTPLSSVLISGNGNMTTYNINKMPVGISKLDVEVSDLTTNNLIVVGGPCANSVAAKILGNVYNADGCANGFTLGHALIKAVAQSNGKVAVVAAGYEADDTRRASRVLANYDSYGLSLSPGSVYDITKDSIGSIVVKKTS